MAHKEFIIKKGAVVYSQGIDTVPLDIQGEEGQLFSVTDRLTGLLHSVNDISGIPIMEVYSDDRIYMGTYGAHALEIQGSNVLLPNLETATSADGTLVIENGVIKQGTLGDIGAEPVFSKGDIIQGGGINLTGTLVERLVGSADLTIAHADTSSQASVNNSNGTVIQDITLDTYGHITNINSVNLDSRYILNNADDNFTGKISAGSNSSNRDSGIYGVYNSAKAGHIWSIGTAYQIAQDGNSLGDLYGMAYAHSNSGLLPAAAGQGHSTLFVNNGIIGATIEWNNGTIWTKNNKGSVEWEQAYDWGDHSLAGYASSSHTHPASDITAGTFGAGSYTIPSLTVSTFLTAEDGFILPTQNASGQTLVRNELSTSPSQNQIGFRATDGLFFIKEFTSTNVGYFELTNLTAARTYTFPNSSGTVALTSDIPSLSNYVTTNTTQTITGTKTFDSNPTFAGGHYLNHNSTSSRDKIRVWSSGSYSIGMQSNITFGGLGNNFAMTFQMSNTSDRGFWWGDDAHTQAQGAMALTTLGELTVAKNLRIGFGHGDTTTPNVNYDIQTNGDVWVGGVTQSDSFRHIPVDKGNSGTGTVSFDLSQSNTFLVTLTGNCTFTFTNVAPGRDIKILVKQDGTGGRTITWATGSLIDWFWSGGAKPELTGTANSHDILTFTIPETVSTRHKVYGVLSTDFKEV